MKGKKNPKKPKDPDYEDNLFICMQDSTEKRRNILYGIKNALVMQEEHEKVLEIRKNKLLIANEIKKLLEEVNKKYQNLRKILPNVKNVISYTEKELSELDCQVNTLKQDQKARNRDIETEEKLIDDLKSDNPYLHKLAKKKIRQEKKPEAEFIVKRKDLSKLDRIKNNLKVIESKLKDI